MTQCKTKVSIEQGQITLDLGLGKIVEGNFDGGQISSDGGLLILRKADDALGLTEMAALCFGEKRRPDLVKHTVLNMLRQRVYGVAVGCEDCNDAARLQNDPMHNLAIGKSPNAQTKLASQPTLSRWENSVDDVTLKLLQQSLVRAYLRHLRKTKKKPQVIRLSTDTTFDEVYGYQQLSFYNGFYGAAGFTPLFIFTEDGFPLAALLRQGNAGTYEGLVRMLRPVVTEIRREFPSVRLELSADAGFAAPEIYNFCELNRITFFIAIKGNDSIDNKCQEFVQESKNIYDELCGPTEPLKKYSRMEEKARKTEWRQNEERRRFSSKEEGRMQEHSEQEPVCIRRFTDFKYQARSWPHERTIVARVDYSNEGPDVRYVITNARGRAADIYQKYCKRSQCENWIKDLKTYLKCDRTSCQEFNANQLRLLIHTYSYVLLWEVRRRARMSNATVETIRLRFLKIGVLVKETARRISLRFASGHPWRDEFLIAWNAV